MTRFPVSTAFLAATASALFSSTAWAQQSSPEYDRYGWGPHMMGWGGGWFGMIFDLMPHQHSRFRLPPRWGWPAPRRAAR
mgnify:CR=1 FL=1